MTKESWNVYQNSYRKNHYKQLSVHLDPALVDSFKEKLKKDGISYPDFMRNLINEYLAKK